MATVKPRFTLALLVCVFLQACGEPPDEPVDRLKPLGDVKEGAPLVHAVHDPGILQDPSSYQPTQLSGDLAIQRRAAGADAGRAMGGAGGVPSAGSEEQIRIAIADLVNALKDGDIELALRSYDTEHVAALREQINELYSTFETRDTTLRSFLEAALDPIQADRLVGRMVGGGDVSPTYEILGPQSVSVTPNVALMLFGPQLAGPAMQLALTAEGWRFQLERPLTPADVTGIVSYHEQLRTALGEMIDWLSNEKDVSPAAVESALDNALHGRPLELPTAESGGGEAGS